LHASDVLDLRLTIGGTKYDGSTDVWVPFDRREERETVSNAPSDTTITGGTGALQADWHLDQATTLTAVLGVSRAQEEVAYDADRSAAEASRVDGENTADTGSIEVRVGRRAAGPFGWLVGVFAARDQVDYEANTQFSDADIFGQPYYQRLGFPEFFLKDSTTTSDSVSLFGEGSYAFDQHWTLTLGARVGYETSELDWNQQALAGGFVLQDTAWKGDRSDTVVLPKGALSFAIDADRMAYGSITQGYRAGGLNTNATSASSAAIEYDAEYTWNYELGWRSRWADRALALDITGFYIDWRDPQVFTDRAPNDVILTNAEQSHVLGAEAEVRWRSDSGLGVWANGGIMQAEFDDRTGQEFVFNGVGYDQVTVDYDGNQMAHIPEWTWAVGASYQHDSGAFVGSQVHGHSWTYVDDKNQDRADGVALIDAQIGYRATWWSIAAFGRNLTDETDVQSSITIPADTLIIQTETTYVRLAPARSVGMEVSAWW
jgi:iron complex outermembrane recepter protein